MRLQTWSRLLVDYLLRKGRAAVALILVSGGVALLSGDQFWDLAAAVLKAMWPELEVGFANSSFSTSYRVGVGVPLVAIGVLLVVLRAPWLVNGPLQARETLRQVWKNANHIDCEALITPDVRRAVEALETTAELWEFEPLNRPLVQRYGEDYRTLVRELKGCSKVPPGLTVACSHLLSSRVVQVSNALADPQE